MKFTLTALVAGLLASQGTSDKLPVSCENLRKMEYSQSIVECVRKTENRPVYCFPEELMSTFDIEMADLCNAETKRNTEEKEIKKYLASIKVAPVHDMHGVLRHPVTNERW